MREMIHTYGRGCSMVKGEDRLASPLLSSIETGSRDHIRLDRRTSGMTNGEMVLETPCITSTVWRIRGGT